MFEKLEYTDEDWQNELEHIEQIPGPPEKEIDPCKRLGNLGMRAFGLQQGVVSQLIQRTTYLVVLGLLLFNIKIGKWLFLETLSPRTCFWMQNGM